MLFNVKCYHLILIFIVVFNSSFSVNAECYFPNEFQGEFIMQSTTSPLSEVQYSRVNITAEAIPVWGYCHKRIGNNVILKDSFSGANCIRCFQLILQSKNILHVKTEGLDKCYTNEETAEATCPRPGNYNLNVQELLLYRTKEAAGEEIRKDYCPIHGKYIFVYNINDDTNDQIECENYTSELDTCTSAFPTSALHLNFKQCSFNDHAITFDCLGSWQGPGNNRYLALYDTRTIPNLPQYRCAMYHIDPLTEYVYMAFSSDSTCTSKLYNSTSGYENLILKPMAKPAWPQKVAASIGRYPNWMQGNWEQMVVSGNTLVYNDHSRFQTLKIRAMNPDSVSNERYFVYIQDECGGESYNCIWFKRRGMNVIEFQLGIYSSFTYNESVCIDNNFMSKVWITQGRLERVQESPCPITGEYSGFIPNEGDLCAKLSSDCMSPEIMYYTLSDCSRQEIYEEREYRCLGQWEEDGLTYTYTQRKDIGIYECFVGAIISNNEIFIKEAGEHCERDMNPLQSGMKLIRKGACTKANPSPVPWDSNSHFYSSNTQRPTTPTWQYPNTRQQYVTKPWKPITAPPKMKNEINSGCSMIVPFWTTIFSCFTILLGITFF